MVRSVVAESSGDEESVTATLNDDDPIVIGVPVMAPVAASRLSPLGRLPVGIDHVYGAMPPVTARFAEYRSPVVPEDKDVVVIPIGRIVRVKSWIASGDWPFDAVMVIG